MNDPEDSCLGYMVKNHMTVIRNADGALSMRNCFVCRYTQSALYVSAVFVLQKSLDIGYSH